MNQIILSGIQITISIWEMWMCYEILYMTVLDKKYADKKETIIRWANIFVVGSLLGINRLIAFFSRTMLGLVVILTIMCMYGIKRKKVVLSAGIVFVYFEFIAILDFILAFISMEFIKEQFEHVIYIYALTWQKVLIYFFTKAGHSVSAICRRYVRILEKLLDQDDEFKLKYNNIRDEKTNLTCDI